MSLESAKRASQEHKARKKPKTCAQRQAELDRAQKALDKSKAQDAKREKKAEALVEKRRKAEDKRIAERRAKEDKARKAKFGCVARPRKPRKPRASKPAGEGGTPTVAKKTAKKSTKKAGKKAAKKAGAKKATKKAGKKAAKRSSGASNDETPPRALASSPEHVTGHLSVSVALLPLRRAIRLARQTHVASGHAVELATLYTADNELLLHVPVGGGDFIVCMGAEVHAVGSVRVELAGLKELKFSGDAGRVRIHIEAGRLAFLHEDATTTLQTSAAERPESHAGASLRTEPADPEVLARSIESVLYAAYRMDSARPAISSVYLEKDGEDSRFTATDGHRLCTHEDTVPWVPQALSHLLLGLDQARRLPPLLHAADAASLAYAPRGSKQVLVFAGTSQKPGPENVLRWNLVLPELLAVFPPYRQVIPKTFTHLCEVHAADLRAALEPLSSRETTATILVKYADGRLHFTRTDDAAEGTSSSVKMACEPGEGLEFKLNPRYVLDAIRHGPIADSKVSLHYLKGKKTDDAIPILLVAKGIGWKTTAVIMPIRM